MCILRISERLTPPDTPPTPTATTTPCAQRLRRTTGVWYQAELKLCQHIQSARLTFQNPPPLPPSSTTFVSYLRHRHKVGCTHNDTQTRTRNFTVPSVYSARLFFCVCAHVVSKSRLARESFHCSPRGLLLNVQAKDMDGNKRYYSLTGSKLTSPKSIAISLRCVQCALGFVNWVQLP